MEDFGEWETSGRLEISMIEGEHLIGFQTDCFDNLYAITNLNRKFRIINSVYGIFDAMEDTQ